ncbi:hypothetical protein K456DRAFT_1081131 [Colletotrichum gloeosporioides 23]|nr:hypothetical protein K456DRAFT_1081131 [Colletotrichum gloeosporioides 23]
MVIDNVDNADGFFQERMRCGMTPSECIPHCSRGSLLFTTRSRYIAVDLAIPSKPINVREMSKSEGIQLVKLRLQREEADMDIIELLESLEYIPLAINQAVAFMVKRQKTIQEYLERYRRNEIAKAMLLSHEFSDHARPGSSMESVAKTWMISFESIQTIDQRASELLYLISFFQNQGIPAQLLQSREEDYFDFEDSAALLQAYSFINANENGSTFSTHRLVQVATKLWLRKMMPSYVDKWALSALNSVNSMFPRPTSYSEAKYFNQCAGLLPHAESVLQHSFTLEDQDIGRTKAILLNSTGRYLHWMGNYEEARTRFQQSREMNLKHLGATHINTLESTGLLGWSLAEYHEDKSAIPILEQLVKDRTELLGENDRQTIDALSDLAVAVALTDDKERSEKMQREALSRSTQFLGSQSLPTMDCMARLASVLSDQGKNIEAESLYRKVFEVKGDILEPAHPDVLVHESNLTLHLAYQHETSEEAFRMFRHNLQLKRGVLGVDHRETIVTSWNLAVTLENNGQNAEALQVGEKVLSEMDNSPRTKSDSGEYLGSIRRLTGRLRAAEIIK